MIISRYFYREIIGSVFALLGILVLIYISHRFIRYLAEAASGGLPSEYIYQLLMLKLLSTLTVLIPLAFFLAILLTLGRMYSDQEMTALSACGIGLPFVLKKMLWLAVGFSLCIALCSFIINPWAEQQIENIRLEIRQLPEISGISAGKFTAFKNGMGVFYAEKISPDNQQMQQIFAALDKDDKSTVLVAETGYQEADESGQGRYLVLENGHRYEGRAGQADINTTVFKQHRLLISPQPSTRRMDMKAEDNRSLWRKGQQGNINAFAELQMRLAIPLGLLLLAPLAVLISHTTPRQGRYARLFTAMLIYFSYNNLLEIAQKAVMQGNVPLSIGVWWVHGVLLGLVLLLFHWSVHGKPNLLKRVLP